MTEADIAVAIDILADGRQPRELQAWAVGVLEALDLIGRPLSMIRRETGGRSVSWSGADGFCSSTSGAGCGCYIRSFCYSNRWMMRARSHTGHASWNSHAI